jgi:hypothetical protein
MALFEFTTAQPHNTVFSPTGLYFNTNTATADSSGNSKTLTQDVAATTLSSSEGYYSGLKGVSGGKYSRIDTNFRTIGSLSISCMMRITGSRANESYICSYGNSSLGGEQYNVVYRYYFNERNKLFTQHEYGASLSENNTGTYSFPTDVWFHFGLTRNSTGKVENIYVNGNLVDTITYTNSPTGGTDVTCVFGLGKNAVDPGPADADTYHQMSSFAIYVGQELNSSKMSYLARRCLGR